jgi:hypothetical protein
VGSNPTRASRLHRNSRVSHLLTHFHLGNSSAQSFISLFLPVLNCHFEIKDSGPEEHADYETEMASSAVVVDGDES